MQRLTVDGKGREIGLGGYPYVGLAEELAAAFANRQLARRGGDPTEALRPSRIPTFRTACRAGRGGSDVEYDDHLARIIRGGLDSGTRGAWRVA